MHPIALSDEIAVGEVPQSAEIEILSKAGFRSLINVQPDGEIARFADAATTRRTAEAAGLAYAHIPIESRLPSEAQIKSFSDAFSALPRPVYAYCYSGGRAAAAWALAIAPQVPSGQIMQALERAGFDASALHSALDRRHVGLPAFEQTPTAVTAPLAHAGNSPSVIQQPLQSNPLDADIVVSPRAASDGGFAASG